VTAPHATLTSSSVAAEEVRHSLADAWRTFRTLVGDDAYEKYCEHHRQYHPGEPVLDRRAFYIKSQQKKWTGINRCC